MRIAVTNIDFKNSMIEVSVWSSNNLEITRQATYSMKDLDNFIHENFKDDEHEQVMQDFEDAFDVYCINNDLIDDLNL